MKIGVNTLIWTAAFDRSHLSLLPRIKEAGFDGVEISVFNFDGFPTAEARRTVEQNGLECTFCSALTGGASIITDDDAVRRNSIEFLKRGIAIAGELGAKILSGPFYSSVGYLPGRRRTEDEWKRGVEALQSLGDDLERAGVTLAIEPLNRFETYFLNTACQALSLAQAVGHPRVGILFDTFHANIEEKDIGQAFRSLGRHLKHVHACENDRGVPGSGHVEWPSVFAALRDLGYEGWLVIESFGFNIREIAAAACIWRDLAPVPEVIAFEGIKFLKRLAG